MSESAARPLADRLRPAALDEFAGQPHLVGPDRPLRRLVDRGELHSMILWGPPGTGKTTLARILAGAIDAEFLQISAVLGGVKEIREAITRAEAVRAAGGRTVLFVDEVHRFNKSQQDAFLPHLESGLVTFIGATTENPAFELNRALLSRARVYTLESLAEPDIERLVERALAREYPAVVLAADARALIVRAAGGDARRALNTLEAVVAALGTASRIDIESVTELLAGARQGVFDKGGDAFYDQISALHKSVRGSDPDAALYWFARMLNGGCDPLYIARRVVRIASEDVGNADPRALTLALAAWDTQSRLGSPEGELAIAQALVFLASAAKSNAVYRAFDAAMADAEAHPDLPVPIHLRNAPTALARNAGHGAAYRYDHDEPEGFAAGQTHLPDALLGRRYYMPVPRGLESQIADKLARLAELDDEAAADGGRAGKGRT